MRDLSSELIGLLSYKIEPISVNQACEELHCDRTRFMREYKKPLNEGLIIEEKGYKGSKLLSLNKKFFLTSFVTTAKFIDESESNLKLHIDELANLKRPIITEKQTKNDIYFSPSKKGLVHLKEIETILADLASNALTFAFMCFSDRIEEELKKYALENQKKCLRIIESIQYELISMDNSLIFYDIFKKIPSYRTYRSVISTSNWERAEYLFEKGLSLARKRNYEKAIKCCDTVLKFDQYNAGAYYTKAQIYAMQSNVDKSLENLEKSMKLLPNLYSSVERDRVDFARIEDHPKFKKIVEHAKSLFPQVTHAS